jgi:hypothetical protein
MDPEKEAHQHIDNVLRQAGWHVQDVRAVNLYADRGIALQEFALKPGPGRAESIN